MVGEREEAMGVEESVADREVAMAVEVTMEARGVAMAVEVTMAAMAVAMAVEEIMVAMAAEVITNLTLLTPINHLVQKVGKIEVMETHLKILNMKVAEAEEKGEFLMKVIHQMRLISNPSLQG